MMSNATPQSPVREGDVLAGKYRVERVLGVGGMGVVVAALHLQLDERVALKFLLPEAMQNQEAVARFAREARAAVKIKSEHVARVVDVGTLENGAPYMVMEYLHGHDLSAVLSQRGPLPLAEAVDWLLQACEAIAEAHALGIVHRDLKPSNLFLSRRADGSAIVKVLDFGISKVRAAGGMTDAAVTKTASVMGSPLYMSPEQMAASRDVDPRSDVWALGAVLYQLLTCNAPFVADTMPELCAKILTAPPTPILWARQDLPPALEGVVLRCLEKNREHRWPTVAHLAAALAPFGTHAARVSAERIARVLDVDPNAATSPPATAPMPYPPPGAAYAPAPYGHAVPPLRESATGNAAWGTTGGPTRTSHAGLYVGVGAVAIALAVAVVGVIAFALSSRTSGQATAGPRPAATTVTTPTALDTERLPDLTRPPPALTTPGVQTGPAPRPTVLVTPPPTATVIVTATATAPVTTVAPPPPPPPVVVPTATTKPKPDIF
jgi:serine/threonine-protein kinase